MPAHGEDRRHDNVHQIVNAVTHLLCFPVTKTPIVSPIWDKNQFGTSASKVLRSKWLCLPSFKKIVPPTP